MNSIRILLVDDNVSARALLAAFVEQTPGLELCGEAGDGWQGLELTGRLRPDLVLLDLIMPGLDGIGFLEGLAGLSGGWRPRVIVLSGVSTDAYVQQSCRLGADYYLVKPVNLRQLAGRISALFPPGGVPAGVRPGGVAAEPSGGGQPSGRLRPDRLCPGAHGRGRGTGPDEGNLPLHRPGLSHHRRLRGEEYAHGYPQHPHRRKSGLRRPDGYAQTGKAPGQRRISPPCGGGAGGKAREITGRSGDMLCLRTFFVIPAQPLHRIRTEACPHSPKGGRTQCAGEEKGRRV